MFLNFFLQIFIFRVRKLDFQFFSFFHSFTGPFCRECDTVHSNLIIYTFSIIPNIHKYLEVVQSLSMFVDTRLLLWIFDRSFGWWPFLNRSWNFLKLLICNFEHCHLNESVSIAMLWTLLFFYQSSIDLLLIVYS